MADKLTQPTDRWASAIASVVEVLRGYAVMIENGEVKELRAPLALLNVAKMIEGMPVPPEAINGD